MIIPNWELNSDPNQKSASIAIHWRIIANESPFLKDFEPCPRAVPSMIRVIRIICSFLRHFFPTSPVINQTDPIENYIAICVAVCSRSSSDSFVVVLLL